MPVPAAGKHRTVAEFQQLATPAGRVISATGAQVSNGFTVQRRVI
jgi:hypothetical protein